MMARFLEFSAEVTAFSAFELQGTGQAQSYLDTVTGIVGADLLGELLDAWDRVRTEPQPARDMRLRRDIFGDEKLGPIARNIVRLWYIGIWSELPRAWTETFGALEKNVGFMVSPAAYTEGLLWPAIGANPSGVTRRHLFGSVPRCSPERRKLDDEHRETNTRPKEGAARHHPHALVERRFSFHRYWHPVRAVRK
jgi:hypothetical protein